MKKKCLSLILGIMLVLSLGACGKEPVTTSGSAEQEMVKDDTTSSTPKAKREDSASKLAENDSDEGNHAEVKIVMIGDILLHEPVMAAFLQEDGSYDFSALFDDTRALSQNSDLAILNQETILGGSELAAKLNDIRKRNAIEELSQFTIYIITAFVGSASAYEAEKHVNCTIAYNSIGGDTNVNMPISVYLSNDITNGTVDKLSDDFTFTA